MVSSDCSIPFAYADLAPWWPLFSAPADYEPEASWFAQKLTAYAARPITDVLELGCGGGNNALYLKRLFNMTLSDLSPAMLAVSEVLNPECTHLAGDMRTIQLGKNFDGVFVHDAIMYMTSEADLEQTMTNAFGHCRPGGVVLFAPDFVRETFQPGTAHGGHDGVDDRGLRYIEWITDPDPEDTTYDVDYAFLLRHADGQVLAAADHHVCGLYPRSTWIELLEEVGFQAHSEIDPWQREVFIGVRRPSVPPGTTA